LVPIPDYHIHPDFSLDAHGSIEEYTRKALDLGLEEICFTTHLDLDPQRREIGGGATQAGRRWLIGDPGWIPIYLEQIEQARVLAKGQLQIKAGVEVDIFPGVEKYVAGFLYPPMWDFVLGSVHSLEHLSIPMREEGRRYLERYTPREAGDQVGYLVKHAAASGLFQGIAHLDYFKRLRLPDFREPFLAGLRPHLPEILQTMAERELSLEINTRAIRIYDLGEPFPGPEILKMAKAAHIERITIGSDSHSPEELADSFAQARLFALEAGFSSVVTYREGKVERHIPL
jgi:histidinol-phosphatase (PHP family)